jgi:hypothetical protein
MQGNSLMEIQSHSTRCASGPPRISRSTMHKELRRDYLLEIASLSPIPSAPAVVDPTVTFVWLETAASITSGYRSTNLSDR